MYLVVVVEVVVEGSGLADAEVIHDILRQKILAQILYMRT